MPILCVNAPQVCTIVVVMPAWASTIIKFHTRQNTSVSVHVEYSLQMSYASVSKIHGTDFRRHKYASHIPAKFPSSWEGECIILLIRGLISVATGSQFQIHSSTGLEAAMPSLNVSFSPLYKPGRGLIYYTAWAFTLTGRNINLKYSTAAESMCLNSQNWQRNLQPTLAYSIHLLIHGEHLMQFSWRESRTRIQRFLSAPEYFTDILFVTGSAFNLIFSILPCWLFAVWWTSKHGGVPEINAQLRSFSPVQLFNRSNLQTQRDYENIRTY